MIKCTFEDGGGASLRHVTINAIVIKDQKILLGKRGMIHGKKLSEFGKWGLLGGFFDRDETTAEAVQREVFEESGWRIKDLKLIRVNDNPNRRKEDRQNVDMIYTATATVKEGESDEEVSELKWFAIEDLPTSEEIAFDHGDAIEIYKKSLKEEIQFPVIGLVDEDWLYGK